MTDRRTWPLALSYNVLNFGDETLAAYHKADIHFMEFSGALLDQFQEIEYTKNARKIYAKAREYDVTLSSIHLPFIFLDPANPDKTARDTIYRTQAELLRAAADSGIRIVVIHPSCEPYQDEEREERLQNSIEVIGKLTDTAISAGVTLALENLPRTCLCRNAAEMLRFLDAIPHLRTCFDTNHNLSESNVDFIRKINKKIVTLHVSDYDMIDEKHWFPGEGKNAWADILSSLEAVGYSGLFTYEVGFPDGKTIADVAVNHATLISAK